MSLGLYLHFPFCKNRCAYCDFYKEIYDPSHEKDFFNALTIETNLVAESCPKEERMVSTIYIGGGTPSMTNIDLFASWLSQTKSLFEIRKEIEFSFETNPESVTRELLESLISLGINRPVFGIQSFDKQLLQTLGRKHNIEDSHRAVYLANAIGYDNWGTDLLFGLPRQTAKKQSTDLDHLVDLDPPHISLYQLFVEPTTELATKVEAGKLRMPVSDFAASLYKASHEHLTESGYERYEVCSFSKPGHECRHNLGYWEGGDYLGLGPSAHSFVNGQRFANSPSMIDYLTKLKNNERPLVIDKSGIKQRMLEAIMLGFRMTKGINRSQFSKRFNHTLDEQFHKEQYDLLLESGHVVDADGYLRLEGGSVFLADEITRRLVK